MAVKKSITTAGATPANGIVDAVPDAYLDLPLARRSQLARGVAVEIGSLAALIRPAVTAATPFDLNPEGLAARCYVDRLERLGCILMQLLQPDDDPNQLAPEIEAALRYGSLELLDARKAA